MGISRAPERMGSGATYLDGYGEGLEGDEDEDGVNQRLELAVGRQLTALPGLNSTGWLPGWLGIGVRWASSSQRG
ncbi:uncharacterized protein UHOD_11334 [Ustilago sp. UG-2017b]|nr:uncharacterized protein UHOD_11334 [Ustilago sp. UG-2017b]